MPYSPSPDTTRPPIVSFRRVGKRFGTLKACDDISFDIAEGEVIALLGENGAGKSTLMKMLYGLFAPDEGSILIDGQDTRLASPVDAIAAGIGMVFQTFSLLPALSVRDNLAMSWPDCPWYLGRNGKRLRGALRRLRTLAPAIDPAMHVEALSAGERQLVELAKVLNCDARLVILDEPTSVLTPAEARRLYVLIRELKSEGVAVVLITHKMGDVEACADRVIVLRQGRITGMASSGDVHREALVPLMMGAGKAAAARLPARPNLPGKSRPRLLVKDVSTRDGPGEITNISLSVASGEIYGIAGVSGNGQPALAEAVAGIRPTVTGEVIVDGRVYSRRAGDPPKPLSIGYVPENPRQNGIVGELDLAANLALRGISDIRSHIGAAKRNARAMQLLRQFDVRPPEPARLAATLSGGNLQKLVIAREISANPPVLLLVFPTMGLDLTATASVYQNMIQAAQNGAAVLWISEELDDLLALSHRIGVLRGGEIVAEYSTAAAVSRDKIGAHMTGAAT